MAFTCGDCDATADTLDEAVDHEEASGGHVMLVEAED